MQRVPRAPDKLQVLHKTPYGAAVPGVAKSLRSPLDAARRCLMSAAVTAQHSPQLDLRGDEHQPGSSGKVQDPGLGLGGGRRGSHSGFSSLSCPLGSCEEAATAPPDAPLPRRCPFQGSTTVLAHAMTPRTQQLPAVKSQHSRGWMPAPSWPSQGPCPAAAQDRLQRTPCTQDEGLLVPVPSLTLLSP